MCWCPSVALLFGSLRRIVYNRVFTLRWWDRPQGDRRRSDEQRRDRAEGTAASTSCLIDPE